MESKGSIDPRMEPIKEERRRLGVDLRVDSTENRLVEEAVAGDEGAFEGLFRIHHAGAMRVAVSFVRSQTEAEDVVQEAFLKAWRALDRFETGSPFGPWIRAIVANESRSRIRSNGRYADATRRLEGEARVDLAPEPSAEDRLIAGENRAEMARAIGTLAPADQRVIHLRYGLGLSENEMSGRMNIPSGTVKSRLSRAVQRLRDHMVIVMLVLLVLGSMAVPPVRAAIERLLGVAGSEKVVRVPELPADLEPGPFDWGSVVGSGGGWKPFGEDPPAFRGTEPVARLRTDLARPMLTLDYGRDMATVIAGGEPVILAKLVPRGIDVRRIDVAEGEGLWIPGGMSHALAALDRDGVFRLGPKTRIDEGVLALSGRDGFDYRIQTPNGFARALELVRTLSAASARVASRR